jgi:hypothetical protein
MKATLLLGGLVLILSAGCTTDKNPTGYHDHWTAAQVGPSIARHALGYDQERDGDSYLDFQWRKKQDINLTLSRHLLNQNPENPFQPPRESWPVRRDPHGIVPDFWNYIHVEGLVSGALIFAVSGGFVPVPVDSLIATFDEGGADEMWQGINQVTAPLGVTFVAIVHEGLLPFPKEPGTHPRPRYPQTVPPVDLSSQTRELHTSHTRNAIYSGPMSR